MVKEGGRIECVEKKIATEAKYESLYEWYATNYELP